MANTLNPYYEGHCIRSTVVDDRLILPTLKHWYFGENSTGDITDPSFINDICKVVQETGLFDLVSLRLQFLLVLHVYYWAFTRITWKFQ